MVGGSLLRVLQHRADRHKHFSTTHKPSEGYPSASCDVDCLEPSLRVINTSNHRLKEARWPTYKCHRSYVVPMKYMSIGFYRHLYT
jgi:hypothetical protein